MELNENSTPQFAVCINNSEYPASLEMHKIYRVLPDEDAERDGDLRVIDESGEDYLFPADYFMLLELPAEVQRVLTASGPLGPLDIMKDRTSAVRFARCIIAGKAEREE